MATRRATREPDDDENDIRETIEEMRTELTVLQEATTPVVNEQLDALFAELEISDELSEPKIFVYKLNFDGLGNEARVWNGPAEQYNIDRIGKQFGSGQYRVKVMHRGPSGRTVIKHSGKVIGVLLSKEDQARVDAPIGHPVQTGGLTVADVQVLLQETVNRIVPQIQQPQQSNPLAQMREIAELMRSIMPAPVPVQSGGLGQMRDMIEVFQLMKETSDPIERGVNASTSDVLLKMVEKFGPLLGGVMQQHQAAQMAQAPQLAPPAAPQLQSNPAPEQSATTPTEEQQMQLKMGLNFLIKMAESGGDAITYANVVLDYVPEPSLKALFAVPAGPVVALSQIDPRVNTHKEWFDALLAEVKRVIDEPIEPEGGTENA